MSRSVTRAAEDVTFENFDPNKSFAEKPLWGIFDGYKFRTFAQRGHAINAMRGRAKLYKHGPTGWKLVAVRDEMNKPTTCDECGRSTMGYKMCYNYQTAQPEPSTVLSNLGHWGFLRVNGKIADPLKHLFVCPDCRDAI